MVPPLLVVVLGVAQLAFDTLIPLLLFEEPEPRLVLLRSPLAEALLRLDLGGGRLSLELGDTLELFDAALNGAGFSLALALDDLGEALGVFLL